MIGIYADDQSKTKPCSFAKQPEEDDQVRQNKTLRKIIWAFGLLFFIFLLIGFVNFIPTFQLKTQGMNVYSGKWIDIYYEQEKAAAQDTFLMADQRAGELADLLGITAKQNIAIFIYDNQSTMQQKKYGFLAPLLGLDWYIGDNIGTNVILTSPANPGKVHDYQTVKNAVLHEIVHAYHSVLNKNLSYWLDNGLAGYLSDQKPDHSLCNDSLPPTLAQTQVSGRLAPLTFANFGGYEYSYTYIEYLVKTYSWAKVKEFIKSEDYQLEFGSTEQAVYEDWLSFLKSNYTKSQGDGGIGTLLQQSKLQVK